MRRLAETAGSLAPSRVGAWTTPGYVHGESWSDMPWLGRMAFVIVFVMMAGGVGLLVAAAVQAGQVAVAVAILAFVAMLVGAFVTRRVRQRGGREMATRCGWAGALSRA